MKADSRQMYPKQEYTVHDEINMRLFSNAFAFAVAAHGAIGQKRKNNGDDYITHPARVVSRMSDWAAMGHRVSQEMFAAAWMHDTIEDTEATQQHIAMCFPLEVVNLVVELTNTYGRTPVQMQEARAVRKLADLKRLSLVSGQAQTIKYSDIWDNVLCFLNEDPDFALDVYIPEKIALVEAMDKGIRDIQQELLGMLYAALD